MMLVTDSEILDIITKIFRDVFMDTNIVASMEMAASDVAGWDSYRHIEIIMAIEEHFKISATSRDLDNLKNVGDLVRFVRLRT